MATYANLYIDQGADFKSKVSIEDTNTDPLDLANLTVYGQVRKTYLSETAYDFTIIKSDVSGGEIEIQLPASVTETMARGRYVYDIFADDDGNGTTFKVLQGIAEVVPRVTRAE